jgi:hypothetical protein
VKFWGPLALCLLTVVAAGCLPAKSAIELSIEASPLTYYHYTAPAWWGRPVTVKTTALREEGNSARATIVVDAGGKAIAREPITLRETIRIGWVVVTPKIGPAATITGPKAVRAPTSNERLAIAAAAHAYLKPPADCVRYNIAISRVDPRYASVALRFVGPKKLECASNGVMIFGLGFDKTWHYLGGASEPFPCDSARPGVLRSLFGSCWIEARRFGSAK